MDKRIKFTEVRFCSMLQRKQLVPSNSAIVVIFLTNRYSCIQKKKMFYILQFRHRDRSRSYLNQFTNID